MFTTFIERVDGTRPPGLGNALTDELVRELKQRHAKCIADKSARELQRLFLGKLLAEAERVVTKYVIVGFVESVAYQKWLTSLFPYPDGVEVSLDHTMKVHRRRSVVPVPAGAKMLMGVFDDGRAAATSGRRKGRRRAREHRRRCAVERRAWPSHDVRRTPALRARPPGRGGPRGSVSTSREPRRAFVRVVERAVPARLSASARLSSSRPTARRTRAAARARRRS